MRLYQRIISGVLLAPFLIWAIFSSSSIPFLLFLNSIIILTLLEFYNIVDRRGFETYRYPGIFLGVFIVVASGFGFSPGPFLDGSVIAVGIALYIFSKLYWKGRRIGNLSMTLVGAIYLGWMLNHLVWLRDLDNGRQYLFICFAITWANDTAAYGVGRLIGRHKMMSKISPNKSVEGAVGGLLVAIIASIIIGSYLIGRFSLGQLLILGLLLGVFAQLGDAAESILKRDFGVKDSGDFVPGHGGVLDVFDSLVFTSPVIFYFVQYSI